MATLNYFAETLGRQHPLYVVKVSTILDESFTEIRKHEVLKKEGLLVEYADDDPHPVLFCSHTWLRRSAPDNSQHVKLTLLKSVLRRAVEGSLGNLSPHWLTALAYKEESAALHLQADDLRKLKDGYVFFDYMSIPQEDREAQGRAIASLVSYVSSSAYFMCLAGPWTHEDFGAARDDLAWSGRGWCRMELAANALSPVAKPMILACSPSRVVTLPPGGAIGREFLVAARVGHGDFTVDADKLELGPLLRNLIAARKKLALAQDDILTFRVLHAATAWLLDGCGLADVADESYDDWMKTMRFESATDNVEGSGHTPLHFAVASGRADLVEALLDKGAPIDLPYSQRAPHFAMMKGHTPLAVAGQYARDSTIIDLLLRRGADPRQHIDEFGMTALHITCVAGNVTGIRALCAHDSTLADVRNGHGELPFTLAACFTGQPRMLETLRDEFPKQFDAMITTHDVGGCCGRSLCSSALGNGSAPLDLLTMILDAGEAVDCHAPKAAGVMGPTIESWAVDDIATAPEFMIFFTHCTRTPALHVAAYFGVLQAVDLFIERGADVSSTANPQGMTPLHLAVIGGHLDVVSRLLAAGADVSLEDKRGRTALSYAEKLHSAATPRTREIALLSQ